MRREPGRIEGMIPDGPNSPMLWQSVNFLSRPTAYASRLASRYGDAWRFHTLVGKGVAFCEASLAREFFAAPPDTFVPHPIVGSIFGARAVIATSGPTHRRQRKLLNPNFAVARIRALYGAMQRVIREHVERAFGEAAQTRRPVVLADLAQAMTLDVILETVFGASEGLDRERARTVLVGIVHGFSPALLASHRLHRRLNPAWRRFHDARIAFDAWVDEVIAARRRRGAESSLGDDVLGVLLAARYDDGEPMSDAEIRDQLGTLLLAGHETSAIAIAWGVYWLLREPAVLAKLRTHLDALGSDPTADMLTKERYLQATVSESLRIEPIVSDVLRECRLPLTVGKWTVPAGRMAVVMSCAILSDPRTFPEPRRFRPERFLERTFHAGEFMPFGGGQRRCLGAAFAEAELAIALGTIASEWELRLADRRPESPVRRNITMGPKRGVVVEVVGRRRPTSPAIT